MANGKGQLSIEGAGDYAMTFRLASFGAIDSRQPHCVTERIGLESSPRTCKNTADMYRASTPRRALTKRSPPRSPRSLATTLSLRPTRCVFLQLTFLPRACRDKRA